MKFWGKLSKTIFKPFAGQAIKTFEAHSIEKVLKRSIQLIDDQTLHEIKAFVRNQQTASGGFADKAGNSDLYYSLFGCYLAEALDMQDIKPSLTLYVKNIVQTENPEGIYLHSAAILYGKLMGTESLPVGFQRKMYDSSFNPDKQQAAYSNFVRLMSLYYLEDYLGLFRVQKQLRFTEFNSDVPCPVTAAHLVLQHCFGKPTHSIVRYLNSFYRNNGSFVAVNRAPIGDLLSTAVSLYALRFVSADFREIKPDCLQYVDSLYSNGGFCATVLDSSPDVEYTFYGLLALGALTSIVAS
jgi:prenyltransferase beta subunit